MPLALLAALYVSEFMHPTVKGYVKPVVEIMAALPSVVLGFLAGLWLAPMIERVVPGLFLLPLVLTVCILAAFAAWRALADAFRGRFRTGTEVFLLVPVVIAGRLDRLRAGRAGRGDACSAAATAAGSCPRWGSPTTSATRWWSASPWASR